MLCFHDYFQFSPRKIAFYEEVAGGIIFLIALVSSLEVFWENKDFLSKRKSCHPITEERILGQSGYLDGHGETHD
jgi:hypothetical protein